jgi:hypothetical protein
MGGRWLIWVTAFTITNFIDYDCIPFTSFFPALMGFISWGGLAIEACAFFDITHRRAIIMTMFRKSLDIDTNYAQTNELQPR